MSFVLLEDDTALLLEDGTNLLLEDLVYTVTGPTTVIINVVSSVFTVSLPDGTFNGTDTVTITDSNGTALITPSVGIPAIGVVVVTPVNGATSFTFSVTPYALGPFEIDFTNGQGWDNPADFTATARVRRRRPMIFLTRKQQPPNFRIRR